MKSSFFGALSVLTIVSLTHPPGNLIGRWQPSPPPGLPALTVYRADGTFDVFLDGKLLVNGSYRLSGDTLALSDPICGRRYYGLYRLAFMGNDSLQQTLIHDTCTVRRNAIASSPTLSRVKTTKP